MTPNELEQRDPDLSQMLVRLGKKGWTQSADHVSGTVYVCRLPHAVKRKMMTASRKKLSLKDAIRRNLLG